MGMYTELLLKCEAVKDDYGVMEYLFSGGKEPGVLPNHDFFTKPRWRLIGSCSSFYHHPQAHSDLYVPEWEEDRAVAYLFSRSDIKNYDGEIEAFLDWFMPYVSEFPGTCIGWKWYEDDDVPTLILMGVS